MNGDEALQKYLEAIESGEQSAGEAFAAAAAAAPEVAEALRLANLLKASDLPQMRPAASAALEARLRRALAQQGARQPAGRVWALPAWAQWLLRPGPVARLALAAVVLVVLMAGAGTRRAVASSLPGTTLYSVKLALEDLQLSLTPAAGRSAVHTRLAETRTGELAALADRPEPASTLLTATAGAALRQADTALEYLEEAPAEAQAGLLGRLVVAASHQQAVLQAVRQRVPAEAQADIDQALEAAEARQAAAAARLEDKRRPGQKENVEAEPTATPEPPAEVTAASEIAAPEHPANAVTAGPPGQTKVPPGQTKVPPGQTLAPPGQTRLPPGRPLKGTSTHVPPGQTRVPPGQTRVPPGQTRVPPGQATKAARTPAAPGGGRP